MRIARGLLEKIDDAAEALVRVMEQHVALAHDRENVAGVAQRRGDGRDERLVAQLRRMVAFVHGHEPHGIERPVDDVEIVRGEIERLEQVMKNVRRTFVLDFEPHRRAFAPVVQFLLHRAEQVAHVFLVDVELAVARHAEVPEAEDRRAWKKIGQIVADEVAHEDVVLPVVVARQLHQPREHARHLHHREAALRLAVALDLELHGDVQRLVEQLRKRVRRIDAERRHHGPHPLMIVLLEKIAVGGVELLPREKANPIFLQRGNELVAPAAVLPVEHLPHAFLDRAKGLRRRAAVGAALHHVAFDLLLQSRDADLEKLIEIRARDREKLHALEQRIGRIERLVQDPLIELEPAQLAAEKVRRRERFHAAPCRLARSVAGAKRQSCERCGLLREKRSEGRESTECRQIVAGSLGGVPPPRPTTKLFGKVHRITGSARTPYLCGSTESAIITRSAAFLKSNGVARPRPGA